MWNQMMSKYQWVSDTDANKPGLLLLNCNYTKFDAQEMLGMSWLVAELTVSDHFLEHVKVKNVTERVIEFIILDS